MLHPALRPQCKQSVLALFPPLVVCDVVGQMLDESCLREIFKYQAMYDRKGLKTVFDRLAHSSIMRMNSASMDKVRVHIDCLVACMSSSHLLTPKCALLHGHTNPFIILSSLSLPPSFPLSFPLPPSLLPLSSPSLSLPPSFPSPLFPLPPSPSSSMT